MCNWYEVPGLKTSHSVKEGWLGGCALIMFKLFHCERSYFHKANNDVFESTRVEALQKWRKT